MSGGWAQPINSFALRGNEGEPNNRDREGARRAHLPHENKAASVPQSSGLGFGRIPDFSGQSTIRENLHFNASILLASR